MGSLSRTVRLSTSELAQQQHNVQETGEPGVLPAQRSSLQGGGSLHVRSLLLLCCCSHHGFLLLLGILSFFVNFIPVLFSLFLFTNPLGFDLPFFHSRRCRQEDARRTQSGR